MGGSSLAPEVLRKTFDVGRHALDLTILDSTDPGAVKTWADQLDLRKTLFIVASKSGTTLETMSHLAYFWGLIPEGHAIGKPKPVFPKIILEEPA